MTCLKASSEGVVHAATADHNLVTVSLPQLAITDTLVGNNDEILDLAYMGKGEAIMDCANDVENYNNAMMMILKMRDNNHDVENGNNNDVASSNNKDELILKLTIMLMILKMIIIRKILKMLTIMILKITTIMTLKMTTIHNDDDLENNNK